MARVLLIRHAQASYGATDYDQLSERGLAQAAHLANWLIVHEEQLHLGSIVSGDMRRHAQTLAAIEQRFAAAGRALPAVRIDVDWNEFDHESVVRAYLSRQPDATLAHGQREPRAVRAMLRAGLQAWAGGELDDAVAETWDAFGTRVERARHRMLAHAIAGTTTLVMSSGGVIGRCAQAALAIDDTHTIDLNLGLRNTGISEFFADSDGWRLHAWNGLPQFTAPGSREWMTYF